MEKCNGERGNKKEKCIVKGRKINNYNEGEERKEMCYADGE